MSDGIKQGIGVLSAFKDALEETIQDARKRGDLSSERAKGVMKDALGRAQAAASGARERLDFVTQSELEALRGEIRALANRVELLEGRSSGPARATGEPPEDRE
jgi:polyhydroxyalkanoate synthesis regulator phasin